VFDGDGVVRERGVSASPALYILGTPWHHTRGSALLGWVQDDAEHIARRISAVAPHPAAQREPPGAAHGT